MPVLGITGGVATGKSTFTRRLALDLPGAVFDADAAARDILEADPEALRLVRETFGEQVVAPGGGIDRGRLREIVFRDSSERAKLEAILHPSIRERWLRVAESFRQCRGWLLVDIPLLFETSAESAFEAVVVVACAAKTQRDRIVAERGLTAEVADRMIGSQQSLASKVARAGCVIWNDGPRERLDEQAQTFAGYLRERYG